MSPLRVTLADLYALKACDRDVEKFRALFGEQGDITIETVTGALAAGIDVDWWACQLFGDEYERVIAAAWAEYQRVIAAAWAEYQRVIAAAWAEYQRVIAAGIAALADARAAKGVAP